MLHVGRRRLLRPAQRLPAGRAARARRGRCAASSSGINTRRSAGAARGASTANRRRRRRPRYYGRLWGRPKEQWAQSPLRSGPPPPRRMSDEPLYLAARRLRRRGPEPGPLPADGQLARTMELASRSRGLLPQSTTVFLAGGFGFGGAMRAAGRRGALGAPGRRRDVPALGLREARRLALTRTRGPGPRPTTATSCCRRRRSTATWAPSNCRSWCAPTCLRSSGGRRR